MAYNPRIIGIALVTTDLARACAFYEQALGFDPMSSARYEQRSRRCGWARRRSASFARTALGEPIPSRRPQTIPGSNTSRLRYPTPPPRSSACRASRSRPSRVAVRSCCRRAAGR